MREYKFRAWNGETMVYPSLDGHGQINSGWIISNYETVMQFTGLKDKNGKEVYEGDIVRILYSDWVSQSDYSITLEQHKINKSYVGTVVFEDGKYLLQFDGYTDTLHHGVHGERHIIGNIYENPELLK